MLRSLLIAFAAVAISVLPTQAQLVTEPLSDDRYHVFEVDDGLLRIDRQTGDITECRNGDTGWICRLAADDRQAYEAEISRLDVEVERLSASLSEAQTQIDALMAAQSVQPSDSEDALRGDTDRDGEVFGLIPGDQPDATREVIRERLNLPTDEELDVVMDTAEEAMRRFFSMVRTLREDMENDRL